MRGQTLLPTYGVALLCPGMCVCSKTLHLVEPAEDFFRGHLAGVDCKVARRVAGAMQCA